MIKNQKINIKKNTISKKILSQCSSSQKNNSVSENNMLVVGATGSLGRQIVRRAIDEGFDVKCIVRPREIPADFLREWGATVVNADLRDPSSIPATMVGVHTVIDSATARPEESIEEIDWCGKIALLQTAQAMQIQRFVFFSIYDCENQPSVPLMNIKACTEGFIRTSGLNYTIIKLCGFMTAIIGNCAIPILEERPVWGTDDETRTAYIDIQDAAKLTILSLKKTDTIGRTLTLFGPEWWSTMEVIKICETLCAEATKSTRQAKVTQVPIWQLRATRILLSGFQWTENAADRLAFAKVMRQNNEQTDESEILTLLGVEQTELLTLKEYLRDYYNKITKKLKEVGAESRQTDFYV